MWTKIANSPEAAAILKLVLHIDQICNQEGDAKEFLPTLLHQLAQIVGVHSVIITIHTEQGKQAVFSRYDRGEIQLDEKEALNLANQVDESRKWIERYEPETKLKNILALPIKKLDRILGCMILANKSTSFTEYDRMVVTVVEARLDNVIDEWLKAREQKILSIENRVMKELDRIRDETEDQGEALDKMTALTLDAVGAQIGFITLYDSEKDRHMPGGKILRGNRPMSQSDYKTVGDIIRQSKEKRQPITAGKLVNSEIESIIVAPMFFSRLFLGAVVLINKENGEPFTRDDKRIIESVTQIIDSYIFQEERYKRLMMLVGTEASRDVEEALMSRRPDTARGQRLEITMLFADIRDYSRKTKTMDPDTVVRMLNDYFNAITPVITTHNGIVDKYVGDEVVALFTHSTAAGSHHLLAVEAALALQAELERVNREWELTGRPTIEVGIGIHSGEVVLGQIGSYERKDYTAIGANMNFAARLQSIAKPGEIIISESTYVGLTGKITARRIGPFNIKGFGEIMAYLAEGKSPDQF